MSRMRHPLRSLVADRGAAVAAETAILLPVLLLLVLGALDVARYARTVATVDRVAVTAADLVTKCQPVTHLVPGSINPCDTGVIIKAATLVGGDIGLEANGQVIISSVGWYVVPTNPYGAQAVLWQDQSSFKVAGTTSAVGKPGMTATLPAKQILPNNHNVIVVEVFLRFQPWSSLAVFDTLIYRTAMFRPRDPLDLRV